MPQPYELTVSQASQQIKEKKLSPVDLAQSLLERIDATESDLKAWVTIDREEVLTTAKQLEEEASQGKSRGLLHGGGLEARRAAGDTPVHAVQACSLDDWCLQRHAAPTE